MLNFNIFQLTSEQHALISVYRNKWQQIALSSATSDRTSATTAINAAYEFIDLPKPDILFFSTPYAALEHIYNEVKNSWGKIEDTSLGNAVADSLVDKLLGNIRTQLKQEILEQLQGNVDNGLAASIASETVIKLQEAKLIPIIWSNISDMALSSAQNSDADEIIKAIFEMFLRLGFVFNTYFSLPAWQTYRQINQFFLGNQQSGDNLIQMVSMLFTGNFNNKDPGKYQLPAIEMSSRFTNVFVPEVMADYGYYIDYCHEVLNCDRDATKWDIFYALITNCGWIFPYEKTAIVCDRH